MEDSQQGRCAGCRKQGPVRRIERHVRTCPKFLVLVAREPHRALPPDQEYLLCGNRHGSRSPLRDLFRKFTQAR